MNRAIIVAGLLIVAAAAGCGGGSVEYEYVESTQFRGQRTRIHARSHDEPNRYTVVEGQSQVMRDSDGS